MTTDDSSKTRADLIGELTTLRHRVADLEDGVVAQGARSGGVRSLDSGDHGEKATAWCRVTAGDRGVASLEATDPCPAEPPTSEQEETARRRWMEDLRRAEEWGRRLIACEIHDGLIQEATGAHMHLEALLDSGEVPPGPARDKIELALGLVRRVVSEGRRLISGQRLPVLERSGVVAAVECLIEEQPQGGPSIELIADVPPDRLEPLLETTIYRIAQEAITNVRRHSKSDRAEIRLSRTDDRIRIEIRDWGVGFDPAHVERKRLGLEGIRERARLLRGRAEIDSAPGGGTRVLVDLPLAYPAGEAAIINDRSTE